MKILLIKNSLPYPLRSGQDLVDYSLIRALSKKHEITLISPCKSLKDSQDALPELQKYCSEIKTVLLPETSSFGGKLSWRLKRESDFWLKSIPLAVSDLFYEPLRKLISETVSSNKFDFAEFSFWMMGCYFEDVRPHCPTILLQHDSNYLNFIREKKIRSYQKVSWKIRNWYTEKTGMLDYEKRLCECFDWVLFLSSADMEGLNDKFDICDHTSVIPIPYIIPTESIGGKEASDGKILFLGGMQTPYNVESIWHFKNSILPIIKAEIPEIMLSVVGNPPNDSDAAQLASPHINFIGFQPDLTETFKKHQILIAPVWIGTGIKTKIIEGLARGMPIVSTPFGVEGMELTPEKDFLLAHTNEEFAHKVIKLLKEPALRQTISYNAHKRFKATFDFEQVSAKTLATYESVLRSIQTTN